MKAIILTFAMLFATSLAKPPSAAAFYTGSKTESFTSTAIPPGAVLQERFFVTILAVSTLNNRR
jgi:hypothetical protein